MENKVILDVDTGVDDALAILLALNSPELDVVGITTIFGNVEVEQVTKNTLKVLEIADSEDIPVAEGLDEPMSPIEDETVIVDGEEMEGGKYVHGKDGLANTNLPSPDTRPIREGAVDFLIEKIESNPKEITLITTAPLTNVATAVQKHPKIANLVKEHIMMGGAFGISPYGYGNVTPVSEFNIWADPVAADKVFCSDLPTLAVGLDVTQVPSVALKKEHLDYFSQENEIQNFIRSLISFYRERGKEATYPHDPIAVGAAIDRGIFETSDFYVRVETEGTIALGQTVVERRPEHFLEIRCEKGVPNASVCHKIDGEKFMELFLDRLSQLD